MAESARLLKNQSFITDWCVAEGKKQNVTSSIRHALVDAGYDVTLYGKMDTGGGICRQGIDECAGGNGYHDTGTYIYNNPLNTS